MKREQESRGRGKREKVVPKKSETAKKRAKLRITGNTEILDLDLLQEEEKGDVRKKRDISPEKGTMAKEEKVQKGGGMSRKPR